MKLLSIFLILAFTVALSSPVHAQCARTYRRREVRRLSAGERATFVNALNALNRPINGRYPSRYDTWVNRHIVNQGSIHGFAEFFPWHRMYISEMEKMLQSINPSIALPYWDWTLDANNPAGSPVWGNDLLGGQGQGNLCRVVNGPFALKTCYYSTQQGLGSHYLRRCWDRSNSLSPFNSFAVIQDITNNAPNYDELRRRLEGNPHAIPHLAIGGTRGSTQGDMRQMMSPNDPVFMLHHGFIDKIWYDWQARHPNLSSQYYGSRQGNRQANLDNILTGYNLAVRRVMNTRDLCYDYEDSRSVQNAAMVVLTDTIVAPQGSGANNTQMFKSPQEIQDQDIDRLETIRKPLSLSNEDIRMFNLDPNTVRANEARNNALVDKMNQRISRVVDTAKRNRRMAKELAFAPE